MAQEVLVKDCLSREMIAGGDRLAHHLANNAGLQVNGLLWHYSSESNTWRFLVASPEVRTSGPRRVYDELRSLIHKLPADEESVAWDDVFVVDTSDPLIQLLRKAIQTGEQISAIRFSRNVVSGVLIDDAYVYKLI